MRILLITGRRLSEVVLATPLVARVLRDFPQAHLDIVCPVGTEELFAALPQKFRVLPRAKGKNWAARLRVIMRLRKTDYDLVLDLGGRSLVPLLKCRKLLRARWFRKRHKAEQYARMWPSARPLQPQLWLPETVKKNAQKKWAGVTRPLIAIDASSHTIYKRWPLIAWKELLTRILATPNLQDATFMILGSEAELEQVKGLASEFPVDDVINLVGVTTIGDVAAHLGECDAFIGLEGGVMHLAAAQGVPTIGLFGPYSEKEWAPMGKHAFVIAPPERELHELNLPEGMESRVMTDISVKDVLSKFVQLWEDTLSKADS